MKQHFFQLNISYSEAQSIYQTNVPSVILVSDRGVRIKIASRHLRRFLTSFGIKGRFRLLTDQDNKFVSFEKVS